MRFMVIVKATKETEAGEMPSTEMLTAMGRFNEEMVKAGVMQAGEGLHPTSKGARIKYSGAAPVVTEGPFPVTSDLVCGFWLIEVGSKDEAIQWMKRAPSRPEMNSNCVRCSTRRISARRSRRNCASRKSGCAQRSRADRLRIKPPRPLADFRRTGLV